MIAAERIASASPFAIRPLAKHRFIRAKAGRIMVDFEVEVCERVFAHPMRNEGPKAFTEKRKPKFGASMMGVAACSSRSRSLSSEHPRGRPGIQCVQGAGIRRI